MPEKTLEHWSSQYIMYRYKSNATLWWPANHEDIRIESLPARPGKALQLELKTTEVVSPGVHEVKVDLGQLWDYYRHPQERQPFYAFPKPNDGWHGDLRVAAEAAGVSVANLGLRRARGWWFAEWMVVLTTKQVASVMGKALAEHGSSKRGIEKRLVRFEANRDSSWGPGRRSVSDPGLTRWLDFWDMIDQCGQPDWPQLVRVPARLAVSDHYSSTQVLPLLRQAAGFGTEQKTSIGELWSLAADGDGVYRIVRSSDGHALGAGSAREVDGDEVRRRAREADHRIVVFLDAKAFRHGVAKPDPIYPRQMLPAQGGGVGGPRTQGQ
ncbi:hypothetical protein [Frankia gtarii]|uniref:hypothetical protein n=1 Tax=Frankia gtarii TaxID=2950102 RepID=UPI0021C0B546|nr:hypothetical protein [Frankia gtarii]